MIQTTAITDIAAMAVQQLQAGSPARVTFGAQAPAWAWTTGLFQGLCTSVASATSESTSFAGVRILPSGTPAGVVAEGATKPVGVTIDDVSVVLKKYAGQASGSFESMINTSGLNAALASVLVHQCLIAFEADLCALVVADTACVEIDAAPSTGALLEAQAAVMANGGSPTLIVLNPSDYSTLATGGSPAQISYTAAAADAVRYLFGSEVVVTAGLPSGTALVLDPSAVISVQHTASPAVMVDPYSGSTTNTTKIIADLVAGGVVASPGMVSVVKDVTP